MTVLVIRIPGEPVAQNQGKVGRWKSKDGREGTTIRQPAKVRNYKVELQDRMARAAIDAGLIGPRDVGLVFDAHVALELTVTAVFSCPVSQHRKRDPLPRRWHTGRYGNCDNLTKAIGDAGEGVLWHDDGQIAALYVQKFVAAQGEGPFVEVRVRALRELVGQLEPHPPGLTLGRSDREIEWLEKPDTWPPIAAGRN